ncbi:MAG: TolC family protein [Gemmatirosa sp.]
MHLASFRAARRAALGAVLAAAAALAPHRARAQGPAPLTLPTALDAARRSSPDLRAAREAVAAAAGRERQAGAFPNPTLAYGREQTSRGGQTNAQDIAQLEQPLEIGGQRTARREAARLRREAAQARLAAAQAQLDFDVARAYALAVGADRRAALAEQSVAAFLEAQRVSDRRLAAGDVSGYAARRLRLEAARYAATRAAAALDQRSTRVTLASLMGLPGTAADSLTLPTAMVDVSEGAGAVAALWTAPLDSLVRVAERGRAELRVAASDAAAAAAEARRAARERVPVPVLSAGYKGERVAGTGAPGAAGSTSGFSGFVAGLSVPLPFFDRRAGAVDAAEAEARRVGAETDVVRRRVAREVAEAAAALAAVEAQRAALAPHLGDDARIAVRAVQASYAEGEITLVEWLDAVRAYQDAESTYATLQAEVAVRRAALARAIGLPVGAPLLPTSSPDR